MAYRAFREDDQPAVEEQYPDRFTDGAEWGRLAERATELGGTARYTPEQWAAITGVSPTLYRETVTASRLWELLADYESARMTAKYVSLAGQTQLRAFEDELKIRLRAARDPNEVRGLRAALEILSQPFIDPDRRANYIKLLQTQDALGIGLYRAFVPKAAGVPAKRRLSSLRPGECEDMAAFEGDPDLQKVGWSREYYTKTGRRGDTQITVVCRSAGLAYRARR